MVNQQHLDPLLHIIMSKWSNKLNRRAKTIKLLEENMEINIHDLRIWQWIVRFNTRETKTKEQINWTPTKLRTCASKDIIKKLKRQST